jgi:hypothetical protein
MAKQDDQQPEGNDGPADEIAKHADDLVDQGHEPHRVAAAGLGIFAVLFDGIHGIGAAERVVAGMYRRCAN